MTPLVVVVNSRNGGNEDARSNDAHTGDPQHIRHARKMFNHALDDDLITYNPFDRLGQNDPVEKDWHYVTIEELDKLLDACKTRGWKTLIALCRLAGLRRGEALKLPWSGVDWQNRRLTVYAEKTEHDLSFDLTIPQMLTLLVPLIFPEVGPAG